MVKKSTKSNLPIAESLHVSWLIYAGLTGVIIGMVVEFVWRAQVLLVLGFVSVAFGILAIFLKKKMPVVMAIFSLVVGTAIGNWRASLVFSQAEQYQQFFGQEIKISGRLFEDVSKNQSGEMILRLNEIKLNDQPMIGKVMTKIRQRVVLRRGDEVRLVGQLEEGVGNYNARVVKIKALEVVNLDDKPTAWRDWLDQRLRKYIDGERADLVGAILLGKKQGMSYELSDKIRVVGLSHVVVASGLHLMIVANLARRFLQKFSRRTEVIGSLAVAGVFAVMAGLTPSMLRALWAVSLMMVSWFVGRKMSGWRVIVLLVAVSLLLNPLHLAGDLSWWLSYGAFAAILVIFPAVRDYFFGDKKPNPVAELALAVVVVQLSLSPILLVYFGQISLISVLANLLVVPLIVVLMTLAGMVIMVADFSLLAGITAYGLQFLVGYMISVVRFLAEVPLAMVDLEFDSWQIAVLTLVIVGLVAMMIFKNYQYKRLKNRIKVRQLFKETIL